jgi:type IV secretory pathway VirD2 relaxase
MSEVEDDFRVRPGRGRDRGAASGRKAEKLVAQVKRRAMKAGQLSRRRGSGGRRGTGTHGRGRRAALLSRRPSNARRVVIKARVVRHKGARFRAAPLARHIAYLEREGVTRDGRDAAMFDARGDEADRNAFAERCEDDRHHFRFIVSPEDAVEMDDLRAFTRELMADMERDLDTRLDWVAIDHWNTDNPHIHVLVRGVTETGEDLVIDRDYIREGMRGLAESRVTLELGPRSEQEIDAQLRREVEAERWTGLDWKLQKLAETEILVDLRPDPSDADPAMRQMLVGRAMKLQRLGLASEIAPGQWHFKSDMEATLRDLSIRGDIIKTMHRAMTRDGRAPDLRAFAMHEEAPAEPVLGRLIERGLHDELKGTAYALIDGADGRVHHLRFDDIDMTGDAKAGAIVELRSWEDARGAQRLSLATRSDLSIGGQVVAPGATWLDRQLVAREPAATGSGFGAEIRDAMTARAEHLAGEGLARRQGQRWIFARDLLNTLRARELDDATQAIADRTGLAHRPSAPGEHVTGLYRERVTLASGRFAMIESFGPDGGMGFQLVPWRPAIDQHLGSHVAGTMTPGGSVDWTFGRQRGLGL